MFVQELWRYPVKSLAGERLDRVRVGLFGLEGDRVVQVRKIGLRVITARTHHELLGLKGTIGTDGQPLINAHPWNSPQALTLVRQAVGAVGKDVELTYNTGPERFDVLPLLVATDGAIRAFGHDSRRLRANIIIGGVKSLEERTWPGQVLRIGTLIIGIQDLRTRCVMTTYDPNTLKQDLRILKDIVAKFGGELALNCFVLREGEIRVGDRVELLRTMDFEQSPSAEDRMFQTRSTPDHEHGG